MASETEEKKSPKQKTKTNAKNQRRKKRKKQNPAHLRDAAEQLIGAAARKARKMTLLKIVKRLKTYGEERKEAKDANAKASVDARVTALEADMATVKGYPIENIIAAIHTKYDEKQKPTFPEELTNRARDRLHEIVNSKIVQTGHEKAQELLQQATKLEKENEQHNSTPEKTEVRKRKRATPAADPSDEKTEVKPLKKSKKLEQKSEGVQQEAPQKKDDKKEKSGKQEKGSKRQKPDTKQESKPKKGESPHAKKRKRNVDLEVDMGDLSESDDDEHSGKHGKGETADRSQMTSQFMMSLDSAGALTPGGFIRPNVLSEEAIAKRIQGKDARQRKKMYESIIEARKEKGLKRLGQRERQRLQKLFEVEEFFEERRQKLQERKEERAASKGDAEEKQKTPAGGDASGDYNWDFSDDDAPAPDPSPMNRKQRRALARAQREAAGAADTTDAKVNKPKTRDTDSDAPVKKTARVRREVDAGFTPDAHTHSSKTKKHTDNPVVPAPVVDVAALTGEDMDNMNRKQRRALLRQQGKLSGASPIAKRPEQHKSSDRADKHVGRSGVQAGRADKHVGRSGGQAGRADKHVGRSGGQAAPRRDGQTTAIQRTPARPKPPRSAPHRESNGDSGGELHPSWAAKKHQANALSAFKGTKKTFT